MNYTITIYRGMDVFIESTYDTRYDMKIAYDSYRKQYADSEYQFSVSANMTYRFTVCETNAMDGLEASESLWKLFTDWKTEHKLY